jgi:phage-related protein
VATIGTLAVEISASTDGFARSMQTTQSMMEKLSSSAVEVELGLNSDKAMRDVENLKKKVGSTTATMQSGSSAPEMPEVNLDSFEEVADILLETAEEFETKMIKAIDLMLAKLKTATIGNSRGANLFVALLKDSVSYVGRIGEARVAWETVRDAELRVGKTAEEARRSADIWQASAVASSTSGIQKVIKGLTSIRDRTIDSLKPFTEFKPTTLMTGIEEIGKKFGVVGEMAGKAFSTVVDVGGKAINFIGNNIGKIAGVLVVAGVAVYASWKAISGLLSVIAGVASAIGSIFSAFGSVIAGIGDLFGSVIDIVGSLAESLGAVIGALYEMGSAIVAQVYAPFDYVFGKIGDMWGSVYDTIMGGFASIKNYILGALTVATLAWLGTLAWDSGVFGRGLAGLKAMMSGGKMATPKFDASGKEIEQGGFLQQVAEKSYVSIQKFFNQVQKMFGTFFATTFDLVKIASDKVSMVVDWVTKNLQAFISKAIDVALYFTSVLDSTVGIFLAMFQGDWSGAGAMALDVVAKVADGMASVVRLVATPLDFIVDHVVKFLGQVMTWLGENGKSLETIIFQVMGQVLSVIRKVADVVVDVMATINSGTMGAIDNFRNAFPTLTGMNNPFGESEKSTLATDTTQAIYDRTVGVLDKLGILASKLKGGAMQGMATDFLTEKGKEFTDMGTKGLGLSKILEDALAKLAEVSRNKADKLDPDRQDKFGGALDPLKKMLEDLKKSLGTGKVVDPLGAIVDTLDKTKDVAGGGSSTASIDTALGTVKMAGSFDKQAMMQKNQLTEAQKQTMILKQVENLLGNAGKNGENFTQVKDASGNMISVSKELTKMVTRMDVNDPTGQKTITAPEMLTGMELEKRMADLKLIAENMLGGQKDMSGVDMQGILNSDPEFLRRTVQESSAISTESKAKFADGGDPEQRKLINETNTILKKIASSKNGSPFS